VSEKYARTIIADVQEAAQNGKTVVLYELRQIYPNLYDLFNQNYELIGGKKSCRIVLGSNENDLCVVDEKFKCLVFENSLSHHDPPLLSRFEKQTLGFSGISNSSLKRFWNSLLDSYLKDPTDNKDSKVKYRPQKLVINLTEEIIESKWVKQNSPEDLTESHQKSFEEIIIKNSTADVLLILYVQSLKNDSIFVYERYRDLYKAQNHHSLKAFLLNKSQCFKPFVLVYTFSKIGDKFVWPEHRLKQINIDEYKSHKNLEEDLGESFI
jgi:hypothetical protein